MKKDKPKVIDEVWTEDRVREFLTLQPPPGVAEDFHMLLRAYQSMRVEDFHKFLGFFLEQGRDLQSRAPEGHTVLEIVLRHRRSGAFAEALRQAGARLGGVGVGGWK